MAMLNNQRVLPSGNLIWGATPQVTQLWRGSVASTEAARGFCRGALRRLQKFLPAGGLGQECAKNGHSILEYIRYIGDSTFPVLLVY